MTAFTDENKQFHRELLFLSLDPKIIEPIQKIFAQSSELKLEKLKFHFEGLEKAEVSFQAYKQLNLQASRKQVLPLLQSSLSKL